MSIEKAYKKEITIHQNEIDKYAVKKNYRFINKKTVDKNGKTWTVLTYEKNDKSWSVREKIKAFFASVLLFTLFIPSIRNLCRKALFGKIVVLNKEEKNTLSFSNNTTAAPAKATNNPEVVTEPSPKVINNHSAEKVTDGNLKGDAGTIEHVTKLDSLEKSLDQLEKLANWVREPLEQINQLLNNPLAIIENAKNGKISTRKEIQDAKKNLATIKSIVTKKVQENILGSKDVDQIKVFVERIDRIDGWIDEIEKQNNNPT